jgi:hypothetical protein
MDEEHHDPERVGRDCHLWCDPDGVVNLFGHFPWVCTLGYPCQIPAGFLHGANSAGRSMENVPAIIFDRNSPVRFDKPVQTNPKAKTSVHALWYNA